MAGSSLLALIDDIATVLDDVAVMTKTAAQKTAGVLGDDLALNAEQVAGVRAEREIPVVFAVAKGSLVNKFILVPAALAISTFLPWAVLPLLMIGGAYLCFEGVEKLAHKFLHSHEEDEAHHEEVVEAVSDPQVDMVAFEKDKIKGAIRTDFILSAEIIVISLGTVAGEGFWSQLAVLSGISLIMTVGVYGFVAGIVKLDDGGLYLSKLQGDSGGVKFLRWFGGIILLAAPLLMKTLSVLGTAAMFIVGGGILTHGVHAVHHYIEHLAHEAHHIPAVGGIVAYFLPTLINVVVGVLIGAVVLGVVTLAGKLVPRPLNNSK